ncbi:MAG: phytanoyl-CoA dioxygenase family protein [Boseongicola sp. SB0673_bin_14]|nr:phytanoyl-CoA dioxygenase family protein [Boseongicola sp. SB0667_bin_21]MYI67539.1 phytanoyl-CoA dioxygenase family protein [Boseongicola sp. SB0673_bin_14]
MTVRLENGRLSEEDVAKYWRDGFLFPVPVFTAEEVAAARTSLEDMERDWLDGGLPLPLNTYKRVNAQVVMPFLVGIARSPAILDVVEGILGPDILIYAAEFFIKEPRTASIVSMHQDLTYWGLGAIDGLVTAWLALSPATVESGCMDFVRGSHRQPILPHEDTFDANNLLSRGQEVKVDIADEDKTPIMLEPGEMSLHHGLTIHGSGPNGSDDRRIGCVIRYVRPDMEQKVGAADYAMAARGEDRFGNFIHTPAPSLLFAPESLELYDSMRAAQSEVMMKDAKKPTEIYS